ncbi:MAG TPA: RNA polymerase sigma factor, partial [Kofleriaceae bacterium]|nr:RNA polymerase sigma factor [Kofleriaceae bacterium]
MTDRALDRPDGQLEGQLEGLRRLARSLVHGDADADDLLQDTAVAMLEHPPATGADDARPVRGWLQVVLRNRWRMDRRRDARRRERERAVEPASAAAPADEVVARARTLEKLASALVALDEPFRTAVIRRYLDGESAADIARALAVPAGTVRWRLKTGLARLRAALDDRSPRWQGVLAPLAPLAGATVKTKTSISLAALLLFLLLGALAVVWRVRAPDTATSSPPPTVTHAVPAPPPRAAAITPPPRD